MEAERVCGLPEILFFFYLYNTGYANHIGRATVYRSVCKVCLKFKMLLNIFVVSGHKLRRIIKGEFHEIAMACTMKLICER